MQFSEYKNQTFEAGNHHGRPDPFNYPMPGRKDTMMLSSIRAESDGMKTTTTKFMSMRGTSKNLDTGDI